MILPVLAYGHTNLRKIARDVEPDHPDLDQLIADLFDTMYQSDGVGLAAPQVNQSIKLFIIDASPYAEKHPELKDFKKVFINARIYNEEGEEWAFNEGCLSFPGVREDIMRKPVIYMRFQDEHFHSHDERFEGLVARVIQHEYDHTQGKLFVDKLTDISKGNIDVFYKMTFPMQKKGKK
jgi:peptide deformylase